MQTHKDSLSKLIPETLFTATATADNIDQTESLQSILIQELSEFGKMIHHDDERLVFKVDLGIIDAIISNYSIKLSINSDSAANLHMLREAVNHYAEDHMGLPQLDWSDKANIKAGELPPNCKIAKVLDARWFSHSFIRITLQADNLKSYTNVGLHFRIGIPKKGHLPVWPHLSAEGKTIWPKGDNKLHTSVYTTVSVDLNKNKLIFDVYAHNNGDTCAWASSLIEGNEVRKEIIIIGPGGAWLPPRKKLIIAGDETALPTIRRTLEAVTAEDEVTAFIEMEKPEDFENAAKGIENQATFLARSEGLSAKNALLSLDKNITNDCYVWFAGEKDDANEVRKTVTDSWKIPRDQKYIAAFWTRNSSTNK